MYIELFISYYDNNDNNKYDKCGQEAKILQTPGPTNEKKGGL